jgi:hypothetical protein
MCGGYSSDNNQMNMTFQDLVAVSFLCRIDNFEQQW